MSFLTFSANESHPHHMTQATLTKLDNRLWTFIGLVLTSTLGTLLAVFVSYTFWDNLKL